VGQVARACDDTTRDRDVVEQLRDALDGLEHVGFRTSPPGTPASPVTGVIVEVQRHIMRDKLLTWPAYVANLRAKLGRPPRGPAIQSVRLPDGTPRPAIYHADVPAWGIDGSGAMLGSILRNSPAVPRR
jgi:hypothetical protein